MKLPSNLRKFAQKHFGTYVKEDIMKKVLEQCPVPASPEFKAPKLDDEWEDVLEEDRKGFALKKWDNNLTRIQDSVNKSMRPLGAIWLKIDSMKKRKSEDSLDLEDTLELIEKAVICVGQANVQISILDVWR